MAGKGMPGVGYYILDPTPQHTRRHIQVAGRLNRRHAALSHQFDRL